MNVRRWTRLSRLAMIAGEPVKVITEDDGHTCHQYNSRLSDDELAIFKFGQLYGKRDALGAIQKRLAKLVGLEVEHGNNDLETAQGVCGSGIGRA